MRTDALPFAAYNWARGRKPYYVAQIVFDVSSPSFTSHAGITGVPGTVITAAIQNISSISQEVRPEEGRTTIGSITFEVQEVSGQGITAEFREQLASYNQGPRDKELRIYVGYTAAFSEYMRVATMFVDSIAYENGKYRITARDKTRELRKRLFEIKSTVLTAPLSDTATAVIVADTSAFALVPHGASFQDAPGVTVGYVRIRDTGEIIRYTAKDDVGFLNCTRGVFGTRAQAVAFNPLDSRDNWPEVEEVVYLELPGPLAAIAVMTGVLVPASGAVVLPDHWHLGMDWDADFDQAAWLGIGDDLYDPDDLAAGFPVRFLAIDNEDGKAFVEREIFQLCGIYAAATLTGQLTVRRINRVLPESGYVASLTTANVIKVGALKHDFNAVLNTFRVDYNWDGEDFTRSVAMVDAESLLRHGVGEERVLKFKGLHTARHTERAIRAQLAIFRDRYAEPPLRLPLTVAGYLNGLEIGDTVRVALPSVQDYTMDAATLDRVFEIQRVAMNWLTGDVQLDLFASARLLPSTPGNDDTVPPLPEGYYTEAGTNIATLAGYVAASGGTPARLSANVQLTGSSGDLRVDGSIWYHVGDLTIDSGVTVTVQNQAQLRIRGFLQVNGTIDGAGRGFAGATEPNVIGQVSTGWQRAGTGGYLGPSRAGDGLWVVNYDQHSWDDVVNIDGPLTNGAIGAAAAGPLILIVSPTGMVGLPRKLQGSSGGRGGQITFGGSVGAGTVRARGGAGGNSGAGLLLICRGLGFGPSGYIDLSGSDGSPGEANNVLYDFYNSDGELITDYPVWAGGGAGGYPGTFYVLLDGDGIPYPDLNSVTYRARRGNTPINGISAVDIHEARNTTSSPYPYPRWPDYLSGNQGFVPSPQTYLTGRNEAWQGPAANIWTVAHYVQYIPALPVAQERPITPPSSLTAATGLGIVALSWNWPIGTEVDYVEVFASVTQDRAFAEEVATTRGGGLNHNLPQGGTRYYWIRARGYDGRASAFYPASATAGVVGQASDAGMEWLLSSSVTRAWLGDGSTSPHTWTPADTFTDVAAELFQFGQIIASERLRITRDVNGLLTWAYLSDDPTITTTASTSGESSLRFVFRHTSGMEATDEIIAVLAGQGAPGPPGAPGSRVLSVRANRSTFSTTTNGWLYVHGFDGAGNPADVAGEINFNGAAVSVAAGSVRTTQDLDNDGWLILETSGATPFSGHTGTQTRIGAARKMREGWQYDGGSGWTAFTVTTTMVVIGSYTRVSGAIGTATILGNAIAPGAVPFERAHVVLPGDITAGSVLANSLAADLVLGTLFRTQSGSSARVELEGAGHVFPFWIGTGSKGSVTGVPGAGAKVYYDRVADLLGITGRLRASRIEASGTSAIDVITSTGQAAAILGLVSFEGSVFNLMSLNGEVTVIEVEALHHPNYASGDANAYRRLQTVQQPFMIDVITYTKDDDPNSGFINVIHRLKYRYDNAGAWATALQLSTVLENYGRTTTYRSAYYFRAKASGWSQTLNLRFTAENTTTEAATGRVFANILLPNLGSQAMSNVGDLP